MREAFFYVDVPVALVDILNQIDYGRISPEQGRVFLGQLNELADKYQLPRRAVQCGVKMHMVNDNVPDEAIKSINSRDYSKIPSISLSMAKPVIISKLKAMGLLQNAKRK